MQISRLVISILVVVAVAAVVGCNGNDPEVKQPEPTTTPSVEGADPLETVYVVVVPPTKTNPRCEIVTDPKVVAKDSKVSLTLINLSGEALHVSFGKEIVGDASEDIVNDGLENDHSWTVPLKTDTSGEYIYTILGKGIVVESDKPPVTCLSHLPNPRIVIP